MGIICDKLDCPYRGASRVCKKTFTVINQFGLCNEYYFDNGMPRQIPLHIEQKQCKEAIEKEKKDDSDGSKTTAE